MFQNFHNVGRFWFAKNTIVWFESEVQTRKADSASTDLHREIAEGKSLLQVLFDFTHSGCALRFFHDSFDISTQCACDFKFYDVRFDEFVINYFRIMTESRTPWGSRLSSRKKFRTARRTKWSLRSNRKFFIEFCFFAHRN